MRYIGRPFKGTWFYEWQIGPFVIQWLHAVDSGVRRDRGLQIGRLSVWYDRFWRM